MKVLVVDRCGMYFGSAVNVIQWAKEFILKRDVKVDMLLAENGEFVEKAVEVGINVMVEEMPSSINKYGKSNLKISSIFKSIYYLMVYFFRLIKKYRSLTSYDLIVCNNYRTFVYFFPYFIFLKICGRKMILRYQTSDTPLKFFKVVSPYVFDTVVLHGTAGYCKEMFGNRFVKKDNVLNLINPVDVNEFQEDKLKKLKVRSEYRALLGIKDDTFVYLCVASFEPRKKIYEMCKAFGESKLHDSVLVHVGDSVAHEEYIDSTKKEFDSVIYLGFRKDVAKLLLMADCFVLASEFEGMPYSIVEAMASSLPVIASNVGSNKEVLAPYGFVFENLDFKFLAKLFYEARYSEDLHRRADALRDRAVVEYSMEPYLDSLYQVFLKTIGENKKA